MHDLTCLHRKGKASKASFSEAADISDQAGKESTVPINPDTKEMNEE